LDGSLNQYLERCRQLIRKLDTFVIRHISRWDNKVANWLAQHASGYDIRRGKFSVWEEPMSCDALDADESVATKASGAADGDRSDALRKCITDPGGGARRTEKHYGRH
jgi:hypothetical protein